MADIKKKVLKREADDFGGGAEAKNPGKMATDYTDVTPTGITNDKMASDYSGMDKPITKKISDVFAKVFTVTENSLLYLKQKISEALGAVSGLLQSGYDAVVGFITKAIQMTRTIIGPLFKWIGSGAKTMIGGHELGFWIFWAAAGSLLAVATVKIVKWIRSKFSAKEEGAKILLNTELIKNEAFMLREVEEAGFVAKKVFSAGTNACKELSAVANEVEKSPKDSKAKGFLKSFGMWVLGIASGAILVLATVGFFKSPEAPMLGTYLKIAVSKVRMAVTGPQPKDMSAASGGIVPNYGPTIRPNDGNF